MKLGILGTADIAFRRFLPALSKCPHIKYAGVASRTPEKGLKIFKRVLVARYMNLTMHSLRMKV